MKVRITHIDGSLPNLALMKLSKYYKDMGASVYFSKFIYKDLFEPDYDKVYGGSIFKFSDHKRISFKSEFPNAIMGGTGTSNTFTIEDLFGQVDGYDYSIYPDFEYSIGFTQRGCRLKCKFCVVPNKEGNVFEVNTIHQIWRGSNYPKNIILLDNDFFGQENWELRCKEIIDNKFKINFNQGLNVRIITEPQAEYLSNIKFYDVKFLNRRIYVAWDIPNQESTFFKGIDKLLKYGINPSSIMVYMLLGYFNNDIKEALYRYQKIIDYRMLPYPMLYEPELPEHKIFKHFQRWIIRRYNEIVSFEDYLKEKNFTLDKI